MLFLLDLPKGEEVTILAQKKKDGECSEEGDVTWHIKDNNQVQLNGSFSNSDPISVSADRGVRRGRFVLHSDAL